MKSFILLLMIASLLGYTSCNNDDPKPEALTVSETDVVGNWEIISFIDDGQQIVNEFGSVNVIRIASNGDIFFPNSGNFGSWTLEDDNKKLVIIIDQGPDPFSEFEEDWAIIRADADNLWLRDFDDYDDNPDDVDEDIEEVRLMREDS